ncbi:MAG: hypothetical protein ACUVTW_13230 [Thermogutta sp.]
MSEERCGCGWIAARLRDWGEGLPTSDELCRPGNLVADAELP